MGGSSEKTKKEGITESINEQWERIGKLWNEWDEVKNKVRMEVRKNKIEYHNKLIKDIGQPDGEANIWKAIDKITDRKSKTGQNWSMRREDGGWCETDKEELEEIQAFCCRELRQKVHTHEKEGEEGTEDIEDRKIKDQWENKMRANTADVRSADRKTHHSKSTPQWSPPTKLCVILEDQICRPIAKAWTKLGDEKFPEQWKRQKVVWIPKPGKMTVKQIKNEELQC